MALSLRKNIQKLISSCKNQIDLLTKTHTRPWAKKQNLHSDVFRTGIKTQFRKLCIPEIEPYDKNIELQKLFIVLQILSLSNYDIKEAYQAF